MLHGKEPLHNSFSYKNRNTAICERVQADDRILITRILDCNPRTSNSAVGKKKKKSCSMLDVGKFQRHS